MASKQDAPRRRKQKVRATKKLDKWRDKQAEKGGAKKAPAKKKA